MKRACQVVLMLTTESVSGLGREARAPKQQEEISCK